MRLASDANVRLAFDATMRLASDATIRLVFDATVREGISAKCKLLVGKPLGARKSCLASSILIGTSRLALSANGAANGTAFVWSFFAVAFDWGISDAAARS